MSKVITMVMAILISFNMVAADYDIEDKSNEYFEEYISEFTEDVLEATNNQALIQREGNLVRFEFSTDMVENVGMKGYAVAIVVIDGDTGVYDLYEYGFLDGEFVLGWEHGTFDEYFSWMNSEFVIGNFK